MLSVILLLLTSTLIQTTKTLNYKVICKVLETGHKPVLFAQCLLLLFIPLRAKRVGR